MVAQTREQRIKNSCLCDRYREFLRRFPEESFPGEKGWKGNHYYMDWVKTKIREFKKHINIAESEPLGIIDSKEFDKWLLNGN